MLLWSGFLFLVLGVAAFAVDRRAAHVFHDGIALQPHLLIARTTDWAKGAHWLVIAVAAVAISTLLSWFGYKTPAVHEAGYAGLAFLACLATGTLIIHALKIVLGRRRPRDELEHGLFGFMPLGFDLQYDSFPSGHALTIFCVAVILSGLFPQWWPLWFAVALYLAMTRALVSAHYLSDVFIGAGLGLLVARTIVLYFFPALLRPWF